ncbi:MAG: FG-GAP repeat protein [Kofleriaceae bacterium]
MSLLGLGLASCNWTVFDDLASETWVERVDGSSKTRFGIAMAPLPIDPAGSAGGANLIVLGRSAVSVSLVKYDAAGKHDTTYFDAEMLRPGVEFKIFPARPALAVDPVNRRFAYGGVTGNMEEGQGFVAVLDATTPTTQLGLPRSLGAPGVGDATARMRPGGISFGDVPSTGDLTNGVENMAAFHDVLTARGTQIDVLFDYDSARDTLTMPECTQRNTSTLDTAYGTAFADLDGDGTAEFVVGMGAVDGLSSATSEIRIYAIDGLVKPGSVIGTPGPCDAPIDTIPVTGFDGGFALLTTRFDPAATADDLVYAAPSSNTVFVRLGGTTTQIPLTTPLTGSIFGYALAAGDLDGDGAPELVVGAPRSDIDGVTDAGAVYIYKFDPVTKTFAPTSTEPLTLSSPATSAQFGQSLAVVPWGTSGQNVLVVGAENNAYTYFRTTLYDDVRTGR